MTNQDYKNAALAALKGNWAPAVLGTLVFAAIAGIFGCTPSLLIAPDSTSMGAAEGGSLLLTILIVVPLEVGLYYSFVKLLNEGDSNITSNTFKLGFSGWFHKVVTMFLMLLALMAGFILLIIPGLILSFAYSMTPYLLVKHPELSAVETLRESRKIMKGHKFDLFYLELSFIGWIILGIFTLGIGYLWLMPYMYTSIAGFWNDVYNQAHPVTAESIQ